MNRVQEAIASAIGMDDLIQAKESELQELQGTHQTEISSLQEEMVNTQRALETVLNDQRMLERAIEDLDYLNLFDLTQIHDILPDATKSKTIKRLRQLRHENPLAKQGIRLIVRFTLGKGITWICKNDEIRKTLMEYWKDPDNKVILTDLDSQKEFIDETATDGEKFLACYEFPQVKPFLKLAEIPMEEIDDIIYDPDNRRIPVYYKRKFKELIYDGKDERYKPKNSRERKDKVLFYRDYRVTDDRIKEISERVKIPAAKIAKSDDGKEIKMFHAYVNPLWTKKGRRGISELFASREWFRVFREFMQDRAIINRAATSIAFRRKVKGGPAAVAQVTGKLGGIPVGQTDHEFGEIGTLTRPVAGAIYDSNEASDLDWMKTDTGAANAKEDGRMLLMVGGAGIGTNIHYFGEGGDANLATAQAMELPMVKNYEDWQTWFAAINMRLFDYVLHLAYKENIPFEDRSTEAIGNSSAQVAPGTKPLVLDDEDIEDRLPEVKEQSPTSVEDVVSWDFPPIITKDVVKHMTAWAQLTNQVAPQDVVVKEEAIKGALTVLGVPNVDQLMDRIKREEAKLELQRQQQRQAMMNNLNGNGDGQDMGGNGKNGQGGVPGWTKAGSGADATTKRLAKGKPEQARNGRVASSDRPGVG